MKAGAAGLFHELRDDVLSGYALLFDHSIVNVRCNSHFRSFLLLALRSLAIPSHLSHLYPETKFTPCRHPNTSKCRALTFLVLGVKDNRT